MTNLQDVEAPHNLNEVAWYSRGHRPGERGRAQIFGHLDSTCCPALFYHLRDLQKGDLITVQYKTGTPLLFKVQWQATYSLAHMPIAFMYGSTTDHGLMLVTCAGVFHRDGTGYDHRLIVYATLLPPPAQSKPKPKKALKSAAKKPVTTKPSKPGTGTTP